MYWTAAEISLFHGAMGATPAKSIEVEAALASIRDGTYRAAIEHLRHIREDRTYLRPVMPAVNPARI